MHRLDLEDPLSFLINITVNCGIISSCVQGFDIVIQILDAKVLIFGDKEKHFFCGNNLISGL